MLGVGWCEGKDSRGRPVGLLPHTRSLRSDEPAAVADERCLAFVLISRAQDECHLSGFKDYRGFTLGPSRFVREAGVPVSLRLR